MSADVNTGEIFSSLEIDTIGEIMNISMGSAATAASTLLDNKVTITTPVVKVTSLDEFQIAELAPAIAVEIKYVEGISGTNILILRKEDIRTILSQMMMTEFPEDFEIDEMAESAICELMNQMMGSSATVLSCFLGRTINISTPMTVPVDGLDEFKRQHFGDSPNIVTISFELSIVDVMESTFMCAMQIDLAKEIINVSLNFDTPETESPAPAAKPQQAAPAAQPAPPQAAPMPQAQGVPPQAVSMPQAPPPPMQAPLQGMPMQQQMPPQQPYYQPVQQQPYYQPQYPPQGYAYPHPEQHAEPPIVVRDYNYGDFSAGGTAPGTAPTNLDLVMGVPVTVTVELGRTRRKIKEILEFGQGTIVELDKQAGSQVDVIVNGQLIAHGDVVVVDDNFSIRITEILKSRDSLGML